MEALHNHTAHVIALLVVVEGGHISGECRVLKVCVGEGHCGDDFFLYLVRTAPYAEQQGIILLYSQQVAKRSGTAVKTMS